MMRRSLLTLVSLLMLWLNVVAQVLFFGGELCKVVALREEGERIR